MAKGPKPCFFFCYVLPVIIVSAILALINIIGLIIFIFMMFVGMEEFSNKILKVSPILFIIAEHHNRKCRLFYFRYLFT